LQKKKKTECIKVMVSQLNAYLHSSGATIFTTVLLIIVYH